MLVCVGRKNTLSMAFVFMLAPVPPPYVHDSLSLSLSLSMQLIKLLAGDFGGLFDWQRAKGPSRGDSRATTNSDPATELHLPP